jgi:hypothetical protein
MVQTTVEVCLGPYQWIAAGTVNDVRAACSDLAHMPIVLFGDIPSRELVEVLRQAGAQVLVVVEGPGRIVRACRRTRQLEGLPAIRFASQSLATLHDLALSPRAYVITEGDATRSVEAVLVEFAQIFRIDLTDQQLDLIRQRLQIDTLGSALCDLAPTMPQEEPTADEILAEKALAGFRPLLHVKRVDCFAWGPSVFLGSNPHGEPITGPLSLVGGRRCFLFGPFFHVPSGKWRATVAFEVCGNVSGNVLKVDIYTDHVITEATTPLPAHGRFKFDVDFHVEEPRLPLQIRLFNEQGAIEGEFELIGIGLARID